MRGAAAYAYARHWQDEVGNNLCPMQLDSFVLFAPFRGYSCFSPALRTMNRIGTGRASARW